MPVDVLIGKLASGLSVETVAEEYGVEREHVLAALAYEVRSLGQEQIRIIS